MNESRRTSMERAGRVGAATMTSRVLGLLREHIFAKIFGAGLYSDAFIIAFRIPNLLRDLFAEGALSSALVPAFVEAKEREGDAEVFRLGNIVFSATLVVIGLITLIGMIFAPQVVDLVAQGFRADAEKRALAITLTRWLMPFLLVVSWAAIAKSLLNCYHVYFVPALAPVVFNLVSVGAGYALWLAGAPPTTALAGWTAATLAGAVMTVVVQLPPLHRVGFRPRALFDSANRGLRRVVRQMAPAVLGLAAVQINILVSTTLASSVGGDVSYLNYAFRVIFLPIGVIGVAVATISSVDLSASAARRDGQEFRGQLVEALRLVGFFTLPATVGLMVLAEPITRLIYEYGEFTAEHTRQSAKALRLYATGLVFFSAVKVLAPAFYALDRMRVPAYASLAAVAANLVWAVGTYEELGFGGLALGTALAGLVNCAVLGGAAWGVLAGRRLTLTRALLRMALLAVAAGWIARWINGVLEAQLGTGGLWVRTAGVLIPIAAALTAVIAAGWILGLHEARDLVAALRRLKWGMGGASAARRQP